MLTSLLIAASIACCGASVALASAEVARRLVIPVWSEMKGAKAGEARSLPFLALRWLGDVNARWMRPAYEATVRRMLVKSGDPAHFKPEHVLGLQELGAGCGLVVGAAIGRVAGAPMVASLAGLLLGAAFPLIWLRDRVKKRQTQILRALPHSLDLLTLAVEAGLDFTAALARVVEKGKAGALREELRLVLKQLKLGKTREEALRALSARVELPPLSSFVAALIQSDRMGTSLGKALRIQSGQMRLDQTLRAEKLANQAPVKMLFPLIACIFPTVFLVLFGPIVFALMFGDSGG